MTLSYVPRGRRHKRKASNKLKKINNNNNNKPLPSRSSLKAKEESNSQIQTTIGDWLEVDLNSGDPTMGALLGTGDPIRDKSNKNIRFAFQNINGLAFEEYRDLSPEVATIGALQLDITGLTELNRHINKKVYDSISQQLSTHLGPSRLACASNTSSDQQEGYLPGGSMLIATGTQAGRISSQGSDDWGRYAWMTLEGKRDEGILVISAYRVSQTKGTRSGPTTAYSQQINHMIQEGDLTLDPRSWVLNDLRQLITAKRSQGYRPILMMDANEDWTKIGSFRSFVEEMGLVDPLYEKFKDDGITATTYARGSRRIDFHLHDRALQPYVRNVGTLPLHAGILSDHVMLYVDYDEDGLFGGIINRPVMSPAREFVIEHADKAETFLEKFKELAAEKKFAERARSLAVKFETFGADEGNLSIFHNLDTEIKDCILAAAKSVAKSKFGYQRSPSLTGPGLKLHFWKAVRSLKAINNPLGQKQMDQAEECGIDLYEVELMSKPEVKRKIRSTRHELWDSQKEADEKRIEWLDQNAQHIARAAGEVDWKKKMEDMKRRAQLRTVNRKLTNAIQGTHALIVSRSPSMSGSILTKPRRSTIMTREYLKPMPHILPNKIFAPTIPLVSISTTT